MKVSVEKSDIQGKVTIPPSKSMTLRALMCASLAAGTSVIVHPLVSEDTNAAIDVLKKIGVDIKQENDLWQVTGGKFRVPNEALNCGESATTMRLLTAIMSLIPGDHKLVGGPTLTKRPIRSLVEALSKLGIKAKMEGKTTPPVTVTGGTFTGGETEIPGNISSQFITALLLIGPFAKKETTIILTTAMTSKPYILMTLWCLKQFGIKVTSKWNGFVVKRQRYLPAKFNVEGDWSSASYFMALGALSKEGIQLENLKSASLQGDRIMLDFMRNMGVNVRVDGNTVVIKAGRIKAISADLSDCIDLLPAMAVLAALGEGESVFIGIERARIKESNRVTAVKEGLLKLGCTVVESKDRLTIMGLRTPVKITEEGEAKKAEDEVKKEVEPGPKLINSYNDHRIAMAFAVMGIALGDVIIEGGECVSKTFPTFWDDLEKVGGRVQRDVQ
jgi:3-phosphoshikimate 1-carboxyvinyltransferase